MDDFQPVTDWEYERLMQIMDANKDKSFVQRILTPSQYPTLDMGGGSYATHRMAWGDGPNGTYVAYPTVLMTDGKLKDYGDDAWSHVKQTGNFITFDNPDEASWFAQKYKGAWGGAKNRPPR